jgi:hypothetical protein
MKRKLELQKQPKNTYTITAEVDQRWFDILAQISKHQDGFVWVKVEGGSDDN